MNKFLVLFTLGFSWAICASTQAQIFDRTKAAAVVNGETIPLADVEMILKVRQPKTPVPADQPEQARHDVVELLVDDLLLQQFLRKQGPKVEKAEVEKKVAELSASLKAQGKTLVEFYRESGQTETQLKTNILNMLQWSAYVREKLSDDDLRRYFEENHDFFDQVVVRASHIVYRFRPGITDEEKQAAKTKLTDLRADIVAGKTEFVEAAKKHSQCPSAPGGGDIGWFPRKWAVDENFAKTAFALQVGDLSDVVQSDYGLHLIKVTDRKVGQPADFEKMKEDIREVAAEELRQSILAAERKSAKIEIKLPEHKKP